MGFLYWSAVLCEGDGGCDSEGPESQRPRVVWSCSADRIFVGLRHYVSPGQHLSPLPVGGHLQHQMPIIIRV